MMLKKKENQKDDALVLIRRGNKIFKDGTTKTNCGAETEGKAIQRLHHLGIIPTFVYTTQTLRQMQRSAFGKDPDIVVS